MSATINTAASPASPVQTSPASQKSAPLAAPPVKGNGPFPNILHDYSSYNYIITLSAITMGQCNSGSYRGLGPNSTEIIARTAGGFPDNRQQTAAGKFDFTIDNLKIKSAAGLDQVTKNTNASGISFTITEPYSIGLFYQSLQVAAKATGHGTFTLAPYLLTIEFAGHVSANKLNVRVPNTTKYICMRLGKMDMTVTSAGAVYNVEAYPWNEQAHNSMYTEFATDISVNGKTVEEMCRGVTGGNNKNLVDVINIRNTKLAKRNGDPIPDYISIIFPTEADGSGDNIIGDADMKFDTIRTATPGMGKEDQIYDPGTGTFIRTKILANEKEAEFKFSQGSDLINAINQIILMSDYGRSAIESLDGNGMVDWWRIDTTYKQIEGASNMKKDGSQPTISEFRVVPYKAHVSVFAPPNSKLAGKDNLDTTALKEYNYIYTGKNVDVLDFNIRFDVGFYNVIAADMGVEAGDRKRNAQSSNSTSDKPMSAKIVVATQDPSKTEGSIRQVKGTLASNSSRGGGGGKDDAASIAAREFFDVVTNDGSLVNMEMTILGDPYFIGDSGLGNYYAKDTTLFNMNSDGAINWRNGEVDLKVTFRNPVDPNLATGMYTFPPESTDAEVVKEVTGLYKVITLENTFAQGKFTQTLKLVRRTHQFSDNAEGKAAITPDKTSEEATARYEQI